MTHPRPVCSPNFLKRTCSFDVDSGLPAAKRQRNAQPKCHVRANEAFYTRSDEPELIREPHSHDVLCGRGGFVNKHPGNIIFRRVVEANKERYRTCLVDHKGLLSKSIVLVIRSQSPPGRFLTRSPGGGEWVEVEDAKALQKTSQALREGSTEEESLTDVGAGTGPTRPSQEEMNNEVLRRALIGISDCRRSLKAPEVALSSQKTKNEITDSLGRAVLTADVAISSDECTTSLEADSATIEESTSKSIRDLSSITLEQIQPSELAAATLGERPATDDEPFRLIPDDDSLLSPYSDTDCLDVLELLYENNFNDASFGLFPQLRFDMDHLEDDLLTDPIAH